MFNVKRDAIQNNVTVGTVQSPPATRNLRMFCGIPFAHAHTHRAFATTTNKKCPKTSVTNVLYASLIDKIIIHLTWCENQ